MKNIIKIIFTCFSLFLFSPLFANTGETLSGTTNIITIDQNKKIKELQENLQELSNEKSGLKDTWEQFRQENGKIVNFIKENLSEESKQTIENLVEKYYADKDILEKKLREIASNLEDTQNIKWEILKLKLTLYKELVSYIEPTKLQEYVNYIKGNIEIEKKDNEIAEDIYRKEEILERKVDTIKEKIAENKKILDEKMQNAVQEKLNEKIKSILDNQKFQTLSYESKTQIFSSVLKKSQEKKWLLQQIEFKTSLVQKKIEIYEIVEQKLIEVIQGLK